MRVIRFLFAEGVNLWKLFVECRLSAVIIVHRAVKFTIRVDRSIQKGKNFCISFVSVYLQ
jgi:hypothetical protein